MLELRWGGRWSRASILGWSYALAVAACNGGVPEDPAVPGDVGQPASSGVHRAALTSGASCARLLEHFQAELLQQVNERAEQARQGSSGGPYYDNPLLGGGAGGGSAMPTGPAGAPVATPSSPMDSGGVAEAPSSGGFSDTTVQVPGVDEADFVKADGNQIYLLHGQTLFVLRAAAADATEILASVAIEGEAVELFARDGKVVVFSRVYGGLPGTEQSTFPYYYYYYPSFTKLTVLDVSTGQAQVVRESYVEGNYTSSRRHDAVVRAIVQQSSKAQLDYPSITYNDFLGHPYSQREIDLQVDLWVTLASDTIADSVISDYLPSEYERVDGALVKQTPRCGDYLFADPGLTQAGSSSVVALDLDELEQPLRHTNVLGYAERVYANDDVVLLSQTDYRSYTGALPGLQTNIHRFELSGADTRYAASGVFSGSIQSQFSLDELDGVIRVSTTESNWNVLLPVEGDLPPPPVAQGPVSRILTLGKQGNRLVELGRSADFGQNEQIYATRFLGDRAYVVTFRQIDPLFVVDLSDPSKPTLAGELQLPGYSNFLYPFADHHLLAIGQDADANGVVHGLALQLFDVGDASAPRLAHKYVFSDGSNSDAGYDHRAISFHPDRNLIALPLQNYLTGQASLDVFQVSTSTGFTRLGSIQPRRNEISIEECLVLLGYPRDPAFLEQLSYDPSYGSYLLDQCRGYTPTYRRGLFRDDDVYAISTLDVAAYALDALDGLPLSKVDLPPAYGYYYPYYGGGMAGAAGSSGMAGSAGSSGWWMGTGGGAGSTGMAGSAGAAGSGFMEPPPGGSSGAAGSANMGEGGASFQ